MPHAIGTRLRSIASADDLRDRCVVDRHTDCWHFRKADGRPYLHNQGQSIWLYGGRFTTPPRAMWEFTTGKPVPSTRVVYRTCDSMDCINPAHLRCQSRQQAVRQQVARNGLTPGRAAALRAASATRTKLTPELRLWLLESTQNGCETAHALGMSQGRINTIRQQARQRLATAAPSIFAVANAINTDSLRKRA